MHCTWQRSVSDAATPLRYVLKSSQWQPTPPLHGGHESPSRWPRAHIKHLLFDWKHGVHGLPATWKSTSLFPCARVEPSPGLTGISKRDVICTKIGFQRVWLLKHLSRWLYFYFIFIFFTVLLLHRPICCNFSLLNNKSICAADKTISRECGCLLPLSLTPPSKEKASALPRIVDAFWYAS